MLTVHKISKSYGIKQVFSAVAFAINPGDRAGLIGPNGSGKTTLLRILAGIDTPDTGIVTRTPPDLRIGYLSQGFEGRDSLTISEILAQSTGDLPGIESRIEKLAIELAAAPGQRDLQAAYADAIRLLESIQIRQTNPEEILEELGLEEIPQDELAGKLSGGQKTRLALATVLLSNPNCLLLDEPTNHLDIPALEWLEAWLRRFSGAAVIVSHDRRFLDNATERILELDPDTKSVNQYNGNYSAYLEQYLQKREKQLTDYRDQLFEIRRMRQDIARTKQNALRVELTTTSRQPGPRRYAKKVARKAKAREKKLDRYVASGDLVEKPRQSWQMQMRFEKPRHISQTVFSMEGVSIGYAPETPVLEGLNAYISGGERSF